MKRLQTSAPPVLPRWGGNGLLAADRSKNQLDTKSSL